jgi:enhancing lycopene biosynthesis protein 2
MKESGVQPIMKTISEIHVDKKNKIITAPCYMMNANILEVRSNIKEAIFAIKDLI